MKVVDLTRYPLEIHCGLIDARPMAKNSNYKNNRGKWKYLRTNMSALVLLNLLNELRNMQRSKARS